MSRTSARLALVCAVVGVTASLSAAYVHYRLLNDPTYLSFCDVNATVSCTEVYSSRYSMFLGTPVAMYGAIWFVLAALLAVAGLLAPDGARESAVGYLFAGSTLALAASLYFAYASFFLIKAVCLLCLVTYAAVTGIFLISGAATTVPMTTLPRRVGRDLRVFFASPLAVTIAALFLAGAGTALAFFPRGSVAAESAARPAATDAQQSDFERFMATSPRVPLIIPRDGAKVLIVKFNDFQCPPCRQSHLAYKSILEKYATQQPGAVKYVLKDYPLDGKCNINVHGGGPHASACDAAVAVRLARQRNQGEPMVEWLFANQPSLTPPLVRQAARDVGGVNDFEAKYLPTLELVKADIALGSQLGVHSTPTFFINGVKVEGSLPTQYFDQAIAYELQHAAGKP